MLKLLAEHQEIDSDRCCSGSDPDVSRGICLRRIPVSLLSRRIRSASTGSVGCSEGRQHRTPFTELVFRFHGKD